MTSQLASVRTGVTPDRYRKWTTFSLWSLTIIVVSGAAVRLTASGLGCSDWPNCEQNQLVADLEYHSLIEFVNRIFTGVVTVAVVLAVLGSLQRAERRRDLVWLSWGLVAGVAAQIVLGGLLVKTDLDPRFTMGHFLLSMVLLWNAVVLQHRAAASEDPLGVDDRTVMSAPGEVRKRLRLLAAAVSFIGAGLLVTGTIVTGSGPHSGSDDPDVAARLPFLVKSVTRVHSVTAMVVLALVIALAWTARRHGISRLERLAAAVGLLLVAQGLLGYLQYLTGVPVLLVGLHVALASLTWISIVRLHLMVLDHRPVNVSAPHLNPLVDSRRS